MNYNIRFEPGEIYHVYNRAVGNERLFYQPRNHQYFLDKYFHHLSDHLSTLAYCLLPNHFHLLIRVNENVDLDLLHSAFKRFFIGYSMAINKQEKRKGALFMKPYKRKKIDSNDYLSQIVLYIHLNPWLHKKSRSFQEYPWSSYKAYLLGNDPRIETSTMLEWFGNLAEFKAVHQQSVEMEEDVDKYFL